MLLFNKSVKHDAKVQAFFKSPNFFAEIKKLFLGNFRALLKNWSLIKHQY